MEKDEEKDSSLSIFIKEDNLIHIQTFLKNKSHSERLFDLKSIKDKREKWSTQIQWASTKVFFENTQEQT